MNDTPDRLTLLRRKYQSQLNEIESQLRAVRSKLAVLDELESDATGIKVEANGNSHQLKYSDGKTKMVDALLDAVNAGGSTGITAGKAAKWLVDNGFKSNGKNFAITIGTSLRRLAERDEITTDLRDGTRLYFPIDTTEFK